MSVHLSGCTYVLYRLMMLSLYLQWGLYPLVVWVTVAWVATTAKTPLTPLPTSSQCTPQAQDWRPSTSLLLLALWCEIVVYIIMAVWLTVVHVVLLTLSCVVCRVRYPPFTATKLSRMKWLMTPSARRGRSGSLFMLVLFVAAVAVFYKVTLLSTTVTLSIILQIVILCRFLVFHRGSTNLATKT